MGVNSNSLFQIFVAIAALVAVSMAAPSGPPAPYHPAPVYAPAPAYAPAPTYADIPAAYNYAYAVADDYAGVNFGANEKRDGHSASGSYNVALPDGRIQTVTYSVDGYGGYVADVAYTGEAKYAPAPAPYHPAPAPYHPAPALYHPAPAPYHG